MARPPQKSKEDKVRIVLAVLRGEVTIAQAARRESTSQTSVAMTPGGQKAVQILPAPSARL
jgi:hypothetical protein